MDKNQHEAPPPWVKTSITLLSFSLFICGAILSFINRPIEAGETYGAAIMCLIFVFLINFESFEGFGVKAKLRSLNEKLHETEVLSVQMKKIAFSLSKMLVATTASAGRWGSILPRRERSERIEEIEEALSDIGVSKKEVETVKKHFYWFNIFDQMGPIFSSMQKSFVEKTKEKDIAMGKIEQPIKVADQEWPRLIEEKRALGTEAKKFEDLRQSNKQWGIDQKFKELLNQTTSLSNEEKSHFLEENKELFEDVAFYSANKKFRRPEKWFEVDDDKLKD